jgi:hypothetical protein
MANALPPIKISEPTVLGELVLALATIVGWLGFVAQADGLLAGGVASIGGALGVRYLVQRLRRFLPAARAGRMLSDRASSDLLAEVLVCWPLATSLAPPRPHATDRPALLGLYLHAGLIGGLLWVGSWPVAVAWLAGTLPVRVRAAT